MKRAGEGMGMTGGLAGDWVETTWKILQNDSILTVNLSAKFSVVFSK